MLDTAIAASAPVFAASAVVALWWLVAERGKNGDLRVKLARTRAELDAAELEAAAAADKIARQRHVIEAGRRAARAKLEALADSGDAADLFDLFVRMSDENDRQNADPAAVSGRAAAKDAAGSTDPAQ